MNTPVGPVNRLSQHARRHFNTRLACGHVVIYAPDISVKFSDVRDNALGGKKISSLFSLDLFDVELSPKRLWREPKFREVGGGVVGGGVPVRTFPTATLSPPNDP